MPGTSFFRHLTTSRRKRRWSENDQHKEEPAEELFFTAGAYGLETLAEGEHDTVDIVFVHGLTGNRETTWTYKNTIFWPKDLLAKDLPNLRIFTFGYDADVVKLLNIAGGNTLRNHGKSLAQDLSLRRAETNSSDRPVIFVAHSLGGLVVEQALLISRDTSQLHVKTLLFSTSAIAFMGTPHLGSRKAEWAHPLTQLTSLLRKTNKEIVAVLEPGSEMLANLQQEFHTMLEDRRRNEGKWMDMFCFYEVLAYTGIGEVVPRQSAILPEYPNSGIYANHSDMTKFRCATDPGYDRVRGQLWLWVYAINKRTRASRAVILEEAAHKVPHGVPGLEHVEMTQSARCEEGARENGSRGTSAVLSSRGPIFMGNVSAGRDFTYHQW